MAVTLTALLLAVFDVHVGCCWCWPSFVPPVPALPTSLMPAPLPAPMPCCPLARRSPGARVGTQKGTCKGPPWARKRHACEPRHWQEEGNLLRGAASATMPYALANSVSQCGLAPAGVRLELTIPCRASVAALRNSCSSGTCSSYCTATLWRLPSSATQPPAGTTWQATEPVLKLAPGALARKVAQRCSRHPHRPSWSGWVLLQMEHTCTIRTSHCAICTRRSSRARCVELPPHSAYPSTQRTRRVPLNTRSGR